jgi:hypothetical protein
MGPEYIWIQGCLKPNGNPLVGSIALRAPLPTADVDTMVTFNSGTDTYANTGGGNITIYTITSDTIEGSFSATLMPVNSNGVEQVKGTFRVCRGPDFLPP